MFARKYKSELPIKECAYCKSRNLEIREREFCIFNNWMEHVSGRMCYSLYPVQCLECGAHGSITGDGGIGFGSLNDKTEIFTRVEWE